MSGPRLPRVGWALVLCGLLAASAAAQPSETALTESGIISDIVDAVSPTCSANITISFGGDQPVEDGELLAPPEAAAAPNLTIVSGGEALFTLLTLDPDAPDPANPTRRSILHYLVTNVPAGGAASEGTEVADPVAAANNSRANFDARAFASQYGLGDPCGVAWFLAQP
ncbi:MFT2 - Corn MFT [Chlorella sorokiniana]|uniref:MFT2-Corn MFT n=1 Tax=Chlorella sorokiniana TaxID=3076 RepID=A0A2P6TTE8_CHLSO|nr:MFT2 - Corn MFT [Chlorella sorokiniana]|eukprot:PRW57336.1 MFT2 - Corn MFT [Chlorella sorokiniana]